MSDGSSISIASVLLEKNRWDSRIPSYEVSDWCGRFTEAGFDGIELWENHLLLAAKAEWEAVRTGPLPVTVLNTYCGFDDAGTESRSACAGLARYLDVLAVKFNFGNDHRCIDAYVGNLLDWRDQLPAGCRLLCECHRNTVLEEPERAAKILSPLDARVEIIVHAFAGESDEALERWMDCFGDAVTHVHAVLEERARVPRRIEILRRAGFTGTWSIEFCEGVAKPPEDMERLLATAADDLHFLRKELA